MIQFERVYTITDVFDVPRVGIANFRGKPHAYVSPFDEAKDDYAAWYELRPIDDETLRLALEAWEIWLRWQVAFKAGAATLESHPTLPDERARYETLQAALSARLAALVVGHIRATATFRPMSGPDRWMEVQWTILDISIVQDEWVRAAVDSDLGLWWLADDVRELVGWDAPEEQVREVTMRALRPLLEAGSLRASDLLDDGRFKVWSGDVAEQLAAIERGWIEVGKPTIGDVVWFIGPRSSSRDPVDH